MKNTKTLRYLLVTVSIILLTLLLSAPPAWSAAKRGVVAARGLVKGPNGAAPIWVVYDDEGEEVREIGEAYIEPLKSAVVMGASTYVAYLTVKFPDLTPRTLDPDTKSVLLSKEGQILETSEFNIGYRVAFYTEMGGGEHPTGKELLVGYDPNEHELCTPIKNALVRANEGVDTTDKDGEFAVHYDSICNTTMTLMAELRYRNFDPQWNDGSAYGTYYVWHKLFDACGQWSVSSWDYYSSFFVATGGEYKYSGSYSFYYKFPVDLAMASGEAFMSNVPVVVGEETEYNDGPSGNWLGVLGEGLLKQISSDDLENTDIYLYRSSNDQLIISREGLSQFEWGSSSYGDFDEENGRVNYRLFMRGPVDVMYYERGWETLEQWQSHTRVNEELWGWETDGLRIGEQVKIVIINRATGYMGTAVGTIGENIQEGLFSFTPEPIEMRPPNLKIEAERRYIVELGQTAGEPRGWYTIGFEGAGLTSDEVIVITTEWVDWDEGPLPGDLPGFTGRLAKVVEAGLLGPGPEGIAQFSITPGRHIQLVRLPHEDVDRCHYYLQVSGEPANGNPDFSSTGAGPGRLQQRPKRYAPIKVFVNGDWVYRPEMQFSLFDLKDEKMKQEDPEGEEYNVLDTNLAGIGVSCNIYEEMDFICTLLEDELPMLGTFGSERELVFSLGTKKPSGGVLTAAGFGTEETTTFGGLASFSPSDILTISLYQTSDAANILWEYAFQTVKVDKVYLTDDKGEEYKGFIKPGESRTATADTLPAGRPVKWSLVDVQPPEARQHITLYESTGLVVVGEDAGEQIRIAARATDVEVPTAYNQAWFDCGCPVCEGGDGSCPAGSGSGEDNSVDVRIRLGKAEHGGSAGSLFLWAERPSPELATPQGLGLSSLPREVETLYSDGGVRQVLAPETLVDVVITDAFSYDIRFFRPDDITGQDEEGFYELNPSVEPFVIWRVENLDASETLCDRFKVSKLKDGTIKAYEYVWEEAENGLSLTHPGGLKHEMRAEGVDPDSGDRVVTRTVADGADTVASKVQHTYHAYPWGDAIIKSVEDPDGAALTTTRSYYEDPGVTGSYGKVESRISPDGSWVRYHYDQRGRTITTVRAWLDEPSTALSADVRTIHYDYDPVDPSDAQLSVHEQQPRTVTERVQGTIVAKTYYAYLINASDEQIEIEERCVDPAAAYGDATNLRTVRTYYASGTDLPESGRIKSVLYADGRLDTYTYEKGTFTPNGDPAQSQFTAGTGSHIRATVVHGTTDHPDGISHKTTKETSIEDKLGRELMAETYVYTGSGYERVKWTANSYDAFGHVVAVQKSDGTRTDSTWGCCGKESDTSAQGITTSYALDALQRVETETREGLNNDIVTTYTYDGAGRQLTRTVTAEDLTQATQRVYDLAGRLDTSTDPAGLVTSYDYTQGGLVSTVSRPGGASEVTTRYLDGRVKSVTGTGVVARYYEYGVNGDGTQWTKVYTGAESSPMWETTTTDALGRTIKVERPGFAGVETTENFYDDAGRLIKTTTSGRADALYVYNELGNQMQNGLDVDDNGVLEAPSNDRINESEASYTLVNSNWWQETTQRVYATEEEGTATTASIQRTQLTGLGTGSKASERVSIDVHGNETIAQLFVDRANKTETRVTDYSDSATDAVFVTVNGLLVSSTSKTGVEMTYSYDALGRRTGVTDPRTGTAVTNYNDNGQVDYVEDAADNRTSYAYESDTGRKASETNALNKVTRYAYNDRGQVVRTWGDATYPVEYVYESYGRMSEIHTYRNDAGWTGETWPAGASGTEDVTTWNYQEATGLLTSKVDDAGNSVSYTYTDGGKLETRTWARTDGGNPIVTTYNYDPNTGELLSIDYSDTTSDVVFAYDRLGRQKTVTDAVGSRTFAYNDSLQLETEAISGLITETITRSYETPGVPGRSSGFSLASDYSVSYGYDTTGRFNSVGWNVGGVQGTATYSYVSDSDLIQQLITDNGQLITYTYEPKRNLRTQVQNAYGVNVISQYDYEYDALGRRSSVANSGQAFASAAFNQYGYNDRNELTSSDRYLGGDTADTSNPVQEEDRSYLYDNIGNRESATGWDAQAAVQTQIDYDPNPLNQYTQITTDNGQPSTDNLTYDDDGNLLEYAGMQYVYNAENRLVAAEPENPVDGDKKVEYVYDYIGRRVRKAVSEYSAGVWSLTKESVFVYDGWNLAKETIDTGTTSTVYYVNGLDLSSSLQGAGGIGGLIARIKDADTHLYTFDGNGNVGQLVNAADGTIVAHYEYDPYGNEIAATGSFAADNPYRFSTKYTDDETGLVYYGYRYYSPQLGRWLNRDPLEEQGGIHLYLYVANNSVNLVDTDGRGLYGGKTEAEEEERKEIARQIGYYNAYEIRNTPKIAWDATKGMPGAWGGEADAVRHAIWHCQMSKIEGKARALLVGEIHEKHNPPPNLNEPPAGYSSVEEWKEADIEMDRHNNRFGADLGEDNCVDCIEAAKKALQDGKLKVNSRGGYVLP